ncbi:Putative transcriptional regulator, TetR-family [Corynebacterium glyciniphilum AJ 3170]|uniref:Putative transcriptional regulator, TetR-family n=1 Tax=Corynebacterium glyciniphilum AJ 3170 TaxID=1404245 RepID=X5DVF0_9CORY|nr:TetR family transcriptional regulator [Corynebacterium glyciniphilum]AHW64632.1 Putative transcriptional regulator, TetR-family [Corynebacterium glyciniphilum AJ 3170]
MPEPSVKSSVKPQNKPEPPRKPGRPRASAPRWDGTDTSAELLDAAAELFTTEGYGSVSTRQLAEAAGIRQATIYHYFPGKKGLLLALLLQTVEPSVQLSRSLLDPTSTADGAPGSPMSPADILRHLAAEDAYLLLTDKWNLASLYGAPEIRDPYFEQFHALRAELRDSYRNLARCVAGNTALPDEHLDLPFYMVESVIPLRAESSPTTSEDTAAARSVADAVARSAVGVLTPG